MNPLMSVVVVALILGVVVVLTKVVLSAAQHTGSGINAEDDAALPYDKRRYLFTKAEKSFYQVLRGSMPDGYVLFAKVRLGDILAVRKGTEKRQSFANRIASKHVDYLICDKKWLEPRLAIELDDKSHNRADRVRRDSFVERACAAASLPLLRVPAQNAYDQRQLATAVQSHLSAS